MTLPENRQLTILDPRTGATLHNVPLATETQCDDAVERARVAAHGWARTPAAERAAALRAAAAAVRTHADELAKLNVRETGKLDADAHGGVDAAIGTLLQYAELGPTHRGRSLQGSWDATDLMVPGPRGVVVVLTPWNDPIAIAAGLIGAALVTGNTVVHKPSERCPATGRRFAELVSVCLSDGALEVLDGDGEVGARLAAASVDLVAHVGSTSTGRSIAESAARTGAKVLLENGGNDPLIVDEGIDPTWAAAQTALGAFANAGQICVSVERIYVHARGAEEFLRALMAEAESWRHKIGPLVDLRHREQVHSQVAEAHADGARILVGGEVPEGPGAFYPPTVLADCGTAMRVMSTETFGPVAAVQVVPDFATALNRACHDRYGLAATVLTRDMSHAQMAWRELPVGTVKINAIFGGAPGGAAQPRGASGAGYGYGPELLDEMTTTKVVHLAPPPATTSSV